MILEHRLGAVAAGAGEDLGPGAVPPQAYEKRCDARPEGVRRSLLMPKIISCVLLLSAVFFLLTPGYAQDKPFRVFDALLSVNKPNLDPYGLEQLRVVYPRELWNKHENRDDLPKKKIMDVASTIMPNSIICIDIEHWPVRGDDNIVNYSIEKYRTLASLFKQNSNNITLGFYGLVPIRDYWRAILGEDTNEYKQWITENRSIEGIGESVDVLFPSLYTFSNNQEEWEQYAIENIRVAKKYGKPVYVFLWPMYHDSTSLKGQYIPGDFWRFQLETCKKYADGIVIWGGSREKWDENASWWSETKIFLSTINE